jgi:hypothetical protein
MSKRIHFGEDHIFTSKSDNLNVTLRAGDNESLVIVGTVTGPLGDTLLLADNNVLIGDESGIARAKLFSGDLTTDNEAVVTLANVNSNVGSFTNSSITVNNKGLITAASSGSGASSSSTITDDTTTNGTMYPTWVTTSSGDQSIKVSSTKFTFNPSTSSLTLGTENGNSTVTARNATTAATPGGQLIVLGGAGGTTGTGGAMTVRTGAGGTTSGDSGAMSISTGASTSGNTGILSIASGTATSGNSGNISIITGSSTGTAGTISLRTNAVQRLLISTASVSSTLPFLTTAGSVSAPSYAFTSPTNDTGMYSSGTDTIDFATAGVNRMSMSSSGIINLTNTTSSTSNATGALTLIGGIGINNDTDATSSTNGGSFTTAGGVAIEKQLFVGTSITATGPIKSASSLILEDPGAGAFTATIQAPTLSSSYTLTLPVDDGTSNQILTTDGSGILSWTTPTSGSGSSTITDDTTTNANMFPTWVTTSSGDQSIKVSSTKFTFNPSSSLLTLGAENSTASVTARNATTAATTGGQFTLSGGNGNTSGVGGQLIVLGGAGGTTGNGGDVTVRTGAGGSTSGDSGTMSISTGASTSGNTGVLNIVSGTATSGNSGAITIQSGTATGTVGNVVLGTNGTTRLTLSTTQLTSTLPIIGPVGAVGAPTYSFTGSTSTGMYSSTTNTINFSTNANNRLTIGSTGILTTTATAVATSVSTGSVRIVGGVGITKNMWVGAAMTNTNTGTEGSVINIPAFTYTSSTSTPSNVNTMAIESITLNGTGPATNAASFYIAGPPTAGTMTITDAYALQVASGTSLFGGQIQSSSGSVSTPSYAFSSPTNDTGMYSSGTDIIDFATAGVNRMTIGAGGVINLTNTTATTSNATGALTLIGGLGINKSTDATSSTNGGSFTTSGGMGIAKKLFVGTTITATGAIKSAASLILEDPGAGTSTVTIQAPTLSSSYTLTLPVDDGITDQVLTTDGTGTLSWGSPVVDTLTHTSTVAELGYVDLTGPTSIQYSDTTSAKSQGTSVSIAKSGSDYWMIMGCPNVAPTPDLGGISIWKSTAGAAFVEQSLLIRDSATPSSSIGTVCHIDDTATLISFSDKQTNSSDGLLYRRVVNTWSLVETISGCENIRTNGLYAIVAGNLNIVEIYLNNGSDVWSLQEDITRTSATGNALIDIYSTTCCMMNTVENYVAIYDRIGTDWSFTSSLHANEDIITLNMYGNTLCYCSSTKLYIATRPNVSTPFELTTVIPISGNIRQASISPTEMISVITDTQVKLYLNSIEVDSLAVTGSVSTAVNSSFLILGNPTAATHGQGKVYGITTATGSNVDDSVITVDPKGSFTSLYPLELNSNLVVNGNLTVTGTINGIVGFNSLNTVFAQTITNNTETTLITAWVDSKGINSDTSSYNTATGVFTINVAGIYLISTSIKFSANATGDRTVTLKKNGTEINYAGVKSATLATGVSLTMMVQLAVSDTILVSVKQNSGSSLSVTGNISVTKMLNV